MYFEFCVKKRFILREVIFLRDFLCLKDVMKRHREVLHGIAELGRNEVKTAKYIRGYLDKLGVGYDEWLGTGTAGIIRGKDAKRTIAFRADIDGLMTECGVQHLCGHDGHTAILLGLVEYVNANRDKLNDNFVFIFQPAEEGPGGAEALVSLGILEHYGVDQIYGLHIYPEIPEGKVGIREGYFLSQIGDFEIDIYGKSSHGGAYPDRGIDAIAIYASLINSMQTIVSRNVNPIDNAVLSVGKVEGGSRRNIVAEHVHLEGTIRCFKPEVYSKVKSRLYEMAAGFSKAFNCEIKVTIRDDYHPVNNNRELCDEFIKAVGEDKVEILEPLMIADDFSYYQEEVPGIFFMLGARNEEKGFVNGLHNLRFNFDEKICVNALDAYVSMLEYKGSLDK